MNNLNFEALTIYRVGAAERIKKGFMLAIFVAYCVLLFLSRSIVDVLVSLFAIFFISFVLKGKMHKKGNMNFFAKLYKSIFYKYSYDLLPINFNFENNMLSLELASAEIYLRKKVNKVYSISPENVANVIYYKFDNTLIVNYELANISLKNENGDICKTYNEAKSALTIYLPNNCANDILKQFENNNFKITYPDSPKESE